MRLPLLALCLLASCGTAETRRKLPPGTRPRDPNPPGCPNPRPPEPPVQAPIEAARRWQAKPQW
jgi:hypothetical protein